MPRAKAAQLPPVHPGEVLREEYMKPYNLSAGKIAAMPETILLMCERLSLPGCDNFPLGKYMGGPIPMSAIFPDRETST